jgi:hypothetical protein
MSATDDVKALWLGPGEHAMPDGTVLVPGETEVDGIPRQQAEDSIHWQPVTPKAKAKDGGEK